ncbi:tripartite tricarboxylate transporter permease [Chelativorans composti]|uniref:Tripartite tricarboxylate transporter permease n=1 Tax=Chelativorans composti TaxID=768533 RepID=A0ABW5DCB6_9HYPH
MEALFSLLQGMALALSWPSVLYSVGGVTLGMMVGVLPGVGPMAAIALILPVTFHVAPADALIMLAGVYYGAQYGGSITSILLNLPGTASSAVVCLDGHPMAQRGRAGAALFITTMASFIGSNLAIILLVIFAAPLARVALQFQPADYFSMMMMGLIAAATLSEGSVAKGIIMVLFGLILGMVGADVNTGAQRFTFGFTDLWNGISIVAVAMGFFGVTEVIRNLTSTSERDASIYKVTWRTLLPTGHEVRDSIWPITRGSVLGMAFGLLPGTGTSISSFVAYLMEKKISRHPEKFGQGTIEGIASSEAANNATAQSAFIPTLSLGIPADGVMALLLAAMMIHGIQPGPRFLTEHPHIFWGLIGSFVIGNLFLVILNLPLIGIWVRFLSIPYRFLAPAVILLIAIGVYSIQNSTGDIFFVIGFGMAGYVLSKLGFQAAPLLLGLVLGPMVEENLRRALLITRGDYMVFLERPISLSFLLLTAFLILSSIWTPWKRFKKRAEA